MAYYLTRTDFAFTTVPKTMALMEEQYFSQVFRKRPPEVQRVDLGLPLAAGRALRAADRGHHDRREKRA